MKIEIQPIKPSLPLDEPRRLPPTPEFSDGDRQGQIESDEAIDRPDQRREAQNPTSSCVQRQTGVQPVNKGHQTDPALREVAGITPAKLFSGPGIEEELFKTELIGLAGRWILAGNEPNANLIGPFDGYKFHLGMWDQEPGALGERREVEWRHAGPRRREKLRGASLSNSS